MRPRLPLQLHPAGLRGHAQVLQLQLRGVRARVPADARREIARAGVLQGRAHPERQVQVFVRQRGGV